MNKIILTAIMMLTLSGCSTLGGVFTPRYDNNEYKLLVDLEVDSRQLVHECRDPALVRQRLKGMTETSELLFTYTFYVPHNDETFEIAKIIRQNVKELNDRYYRPTDPSRAYCAIKTKVLIETTQRALEAVGDKVQ